MPKTLKEIADNLLEAEKDSAVGTISNKGLARRIAGAINDLLLYMVEWQIPKQN